LERAIELRRHYAFETTLGGRTITRMLIEASRRGFVLRIWYVGLASPDLHIERVQERVRRGGHAIPEGRIRERWTTSRQNLIRLLPHAAEVSVWDNSFSASVDTGQRPKPFHLLQVRSNRIAFLAPPDTHPTWAKPIIAACAKLIAQQADDPEA
jgi:predicted ABC-type ATPase